MDTGHNLDLRGLRDHLEDEGFAFEHQEVDNKKLREEITRANKKKNEYDQFGIRRPGVVGRLTETLCFKTVASLLGLTVSNFNFELSAEESIDVKIYEGCLKTVEGFCPNCGHFLNVINTLRQYSYLQDEVALNLFHERNPQCGTRYEGRSGKVCRPGVQEAIDYWNRQRNIYVPDCTLMFDRTSDPWRLSGI